MKTPREEGEETGTHLVRENSVRGTEEKETR